MRLRRKLVLPTLTLALVMGLTLAYALWDARHRARLLESETRSLRAATALTVALHDAAAEEERRVGELDVGGGAAQERRLLEARARVEELVAELGKVPLAPRPARALAQVVETRASLRAVHGELLAAALRGDAAALAAGADQSRLLSERADALLQNLVGYHLRALDRRMAELSGRGAWLLRAAAPTLLAGLLLAVLSSFWVARAVVRSIVDTARAAQRIAESGALSPVGGADRGDEIGSLARSFNQMTERLVSANARLAEADRRKTEFLGMLSHEMRNPLAPIRSSIHVLRHAPRDGDRAERALDVLERQTVHLTRLVDDLLDVTRIVRGKVAIHRQAVDLAEIVRRTAEDHAPLVQDRALALTVDAPGPCPVLGDPTRLAQVIGNLLTNAAKFTDRGGRVELSVRRADAAAELRVRDTGVGMAPALLERAFEPFVQGAQSIARTEGGLGLGLALVKGLVDLHGGTVRAESGGPGAGTVVVVRLPLAAAAEAPARTAPPPPARAAAGRRVLIVDDNVDAAEALADLVGVFGHEVADLVHDGPSAVAAARALHPEVVLCDIGLPGMSGHEVARALRAELGPDPVLVAVSGYAQAEDLRASLEAGFDLHLAKPPEPEELRRILAEGRRAPAGLRQSAAAQE
ncbi:MAG TPA: hybrid sensor histidine kinase/response regulator [Anaeromyxobacter sp.]|nr:hybrid sensor histidine kinase/response regulator [Anaeromyxobacter sp.]